ncbi:MAG: Lrp/AsnC ligand binding domain-containing protein [Euryarchaeota archaeon]|nr:Lrp/AsnC ligand binding domain-containing protein [Euryarchaeota archaeon]
MAVGFVLIKTAPRAERAVYGRLRRVPGLSELFPLFGEFDFVAKLKARDYDELGRAIIAQIRSIEGVTKTHTLTVTSLGPIRRR